MTKKQLEKTLGKTLPNKKIFKHKDTFGAYHYAEEFCRRCGFSVGRMCYPGPTGIKRGDWDIQKWRNLSFEDRKLLDGAIVGDFRNGPVTVYFEGAPLEQLAECAE
jgi:hypothetical protein